MKVNKGLQSRRFTITTLAPETGKLANKIKWGLCCVSHKNIYKYTHSGYFELAQCRNNFMTNAFIYNFSIPQSCDHHYSQHVLLYG